LSGVRLSVLCWCVWQKSGLSRLENIFIYFVEKCYKCCIFSEICKRKAAINFYYFLTLKTIIPVKFNVSYYASYNNNNNNNNNNNSNNVVMIMTMVNTVITIQ
jgi:hypothetical protein